MYIRIMHVYNTYTCTCTVYLNELYTMYIYTCCCVNFTVHCKHKLYMEHSIHITYTIYIVCIYIYVAQPGKSTNLVMFLEKLALQQDVYTCIYIYMYKMTKIS